MLKNLLGLSPDLEGQRILEGLSEISDTKDVRVVGRGTLSIDPKQITETKRYGELLESASKIVSDS